MSGALDRVFAPSNKMNTDIGLLVLLSDFEMIVHKTSLNHEVKVYPGA